MEKKFYSVVEIAEMTGLKTRTIRDIIMSGAMNGIKFGGEYRVAIKEFEDYMVRNSTRKDKQLIASEDTPNREE